MEQRVVGCPVPISVLMYSGIQWSCPLIALVRYGNHRTAHYSKLIILCLGSARPSVSHTFQGLSDYDRLPGAIKELLWGKKWL